MDKPVTEMTKKEMHKKLKWLRHHFKAITEKNYTYGAWERYYFLQNEGCKYIQEIQRRGMTVTDNDRYIWPWHRQKDITEQWILENQKI